MLVKHKYKEPDPSTKVKVREVIWHGNNTYRSLALKMSWCVSVLWKYVTE